ncbi:hypothetical protein R3P38DRAFT_2937111, partial [Favolaschia claudopus]
TLVVNRAAAVVLDARIRLHPIQISAAALCAIVLLLGFSYLRLRRCRLPFSLTLNFVDSITIALFLHTYISLLTPRSPPPTPAKIEISRKSSKIPQDALEPLVSLLRTVITYLLHKSLYALAAIDVGNPNQQRPPSLRRQRKRRWGAVDGDGFVVWCRDFGRDNATGMEVAGAGPEAYLIWLGIRRRRWV